MGNILVLYKSKHGSSKQYAEWIAADLNADIYESSGFTNGDWEKYSTIVFCGGLYANSLNGVRILANNQTRLGGKKIIVVACGISNPGNEDSFERIQNGVYGKLPRAMRENVKVFQLRGGIKYSTLGFFEKLIMKMLENVVKKRNPDKLSPEEQQMASVLGKDFNFVDRAFIQPIVDYCKA